MHAAGFRAGQSVSPSAAWVARRYGSMVFMMFDPVAPVNTGTSVTGIGCVFARPATEPMLPATSRGVSWRMQIASTRPG